MKPLSLKTKKIIAREFLLLTSAITLCGIAYLGMFIWDSFKEHQIEHYQTMISANKKLADSLDKKVDYYLHKNSIQQRFYDYYSRTYQLGSFKGMQTNFKNPDAVNALYTTISKDNSLGTFQYFVDSLGIYASIIPTRSDSSLYAKGQLLLNQNGNYEYNINHIQNQILTNEDRLYYTLIVFILIAVFIYPIRFFVTSLNWSIKTMQTTEQ